MSIFSRYTLSSTARATLSTFLSTLLRPNGNLILSFTSALTLSAALLTALAVTCPSS